MEFLENDNIFVVFCCKMYAKAHWKHKINENKNLNESKQKKISTEIRLVKAYTMGLDTLEHAMLSATFEAQRVETTSNRSILRATFVHSPNKNC